MSRTIEFVKDLQPSFKIAFGLVLVSVILAIVGLVSGSASGYFDWALYILLFPIAIISFAGASHFGGPLAIHPSAEAESGDHSAGTSFRQASQAAKGRRGSGTL
ncbi:MAG: hypothetical protein RIC85_03930 [Gammaproteobacteria bacterium]